MNNTGSWCWTFAESGHGSPAARESLCGTSSTRWSPPLVNCRDWTVTLAPDELIEFEAANVRRRAVRHAPWPVAVIR
jgi:hypothetical protein